MSVATHVIDRFWSKADITAPEDCWQWSGAADKDGYGQASIGGYKTGAHRWAWILTNGEIPAGLVIDHLCRNRMCVNPAHLEPVTNAENIKRGMHGSLQANCHRGHPLSGDNARAYNGRRICRACQRISMRRRRERGR